MKRNKLIIITMSSLLVIGTIGFKIYDYFDQRVVSNSNIIDDEMSYVSNGVNLKVLSTEELEDGRIQRVVKYSVYPSESNDHRVNVEVKFNDESNCDEYLTYSKVEDLMQITFTCHKAFSKKIIAIISSVSNPEAKAEITFDYVKRIKGITQSGNEYEDSDAIEPLSSIDFKFETMFTVLMSDGTIDPKYEYKYNEAGMKVTPNFLPENPTITYYCIPNLCALFLDCILSGGATPTSEQIFNCVEKQYQPEWYAYLKDITINDATPFKLHYVVEINGSSQNYEGEFAFNYYSTGDYSQYSSKVEDIIISDDNIIF